MEFSTGAVDSMANSVSVLTASGPMAAILVEGGGKGAEGNTRMGVQGGSR